MPQLHAEGTCEAGDVLNKVVPAGQGGGGADPRSRAGQVFVGLSLVAVDPPAFVLKLFFSFFFFWGGGGV